MKFGPVPLDEAEGAILAHSVKLADRAFKKGRRLAAADLAALADAGHDAVVAARLEPDDVGEDEAARLLAERLLGSHLTAAPAFTGRVNLFAAAAGLVLVDRSRIDRLNQQHEAITVATLAEHAVVRPKQMVATIKIIPFAVPRPLLDACLAIAEDGPRMVSLAPFRPRTVTLIQTRLPGQKESVLDKTVAVTAERLGPLGGRLVAEMRCAHTVDALADRLRASRGELVLIAGASAITDRRDVLPAAVAAAGGEIQQFGMPVDPGNLLLLARQAERPVLGLPGCARSPKPNGFDWVLQRICADLPVGPAEVMAMGVGGLLMEIPSRPQPREGQAAAASGPIVAIVLAAGQSRRMGEANKLLAPIDGLAMVAHVVDAVLASRADTVLVVTGHEAAAVRTALAGRPVRFVDNPAYAAGLSTSLQAGLAALPENCAGVLIALGDMPKVGRAEIDRLIAAFNPNEGRSICVPTVRGKRGNPVLFAARFVPEMAALSGDVGARRLLAGHSDEVCEIDMDDGATLLDIDTPAALAALTGAEA